MEPQELSESVEQARESGEKRVGMTMAITAVLLAVVTMLGHRSHTEELLLQTRAADQWAFYQARNLRAQMYSANAKMSALVSGEGARKTADEFAAEAERIRGNAEETQKEAKALEDETAAAARRAGTFDFAEILLEISIVLCSIALLTQARVYWRISFLSTLGGVALIGIAFLRH